MSFVSLLHSSASFLGAAPILYMYVQEAILNLPHPYLRSTTVLLDIKKYSFCSSAIQKHKYNILHLLT